jgi:copper oxidase (laccase) domain-containing protein
MLTNSEISYGFFTRSGGVSKKPYKSLNCGFNNEDNNLNVKNNIEIVRQNLN